MAIRGIVFDKDGVLVDFQRTYAPATREVIEKLSGGDAAIARSMASSVDFDPDAVSFTSKSIVIAGTAADIARAWHRHLRDWQLEELIKRVEDLYDDVTVRHVLPFDDVPQTLAELSSSGLKLGIATNDTQESAHRHLDAFGQKHHFDFIAGYNSGHGAKPGPGMILAFAKAVGLEPHEVIMIGDSTHDLAAGKAAGAVKVGVTTGLAGHHDLAPHADHVIDALSKLPGLVSRLNGT